MRTVPAVVDTTGDTYSPPGRSTPLRRKVTESSAVGSRLSTPTANLPAVLLCNLKLMDSVPLRLALLALPQPLLHTPMAVPLGTLDTPYDTPPQKHIYVDSKAPWVVIGDGYPQEPQG